MNAARQLQTRERLAEVHSFPVAPIRALAGHFPANAECRRTPRSQPVRYNPAPEPKLRAPGTCRHCGKPSSEGRATCSERCRRAVCNTRKHERDAASHYCRVCRGPRRGNGLTCSLKCRAVLKNRYRMKCNGWNSKFAVKVGGLFLVTPRQTISALRVEGARAFKGTEEEAKALAYRAHAQGVDGLKVVRVWSRKAKRKAGNRAVKR